MSLISKDIEEFSSMKALVLKALGYLPMEWAELLISRIRTARLRQRLGSCGECVVISNGLFVERPELVHLGDSVSLSPNISIMGAGGVVIRDNAMLATRTLILTTQHDPKAEIMCRTAVHAKVEIGEFAWIGAGATLLPGVTVGRHAVVGAGAVVTKDVPPYALAVGVPARVLRDRRKPSNTRSVKAACHD